MKRGFTLIELLIVVAIIAILAAIAIPNFLQAQIRAKITKAKSDLRTIALAAESYGIDHNTYPPHSPNWWYFFGSNEWPSNPNPQYPDPGTLTYLTTPIAYISGIDADPFAWDPQGGGYNTPYSYVNTQYIYLPESSKANWLALQPGVGAWMLWSGGPDLLPDQIGYYVRDAMGYNGEPDTVDWEAFDSMLYDPTNGLTSNGDIMRSQKDPQGRATGIRN